MGLVDLALLVIFKFLNDEQGFLQDFFLGRGGGGGGGLGRRVTRLTTPTFAETTLFD